VCLGITGTAAALAPGVPSPASVVQATDMLYVQHLAASHAAGEGGVDGRGVLAEAEQRSASAHAEAAAAAARAAAAKAAAAKAAAARAAARRAAERQVAARQVATQSAAQLGATQAPSSAAAGNSPAAPAMSGSPEQIAQRLLASYGWSGQYSCLYSLWYRESGWNPSAENPSSGAFGIPQALPGSKMASAGADWATNPATQIRWGLSYIQSVYGTPCGAWSHEESAGWY
jgi:pyruvate/2-oxoglutarate dehydrogenase complex dihydrolipoamide acyltransferase (E2) component